MVILTSLLATVAVLCVALATLGFTLARRMTALRDLQAQHEQVSNALTLLTEATESGFRWTASELQRVTALQRRHQWPQDVQQRLERASTLGQSIPQIAADEGIPESEVQLRAHLATAREAFPQEKDRSENERSRSTPPVAARDADADLARQKDDRPEGRAPLATYVAAVPDASTSAPDDDRSESESPLPTPLAAVRDAAASTQEVHVGSV